MVVIQEPKPSYYNRTGHSTTAHHHHQSYLLDRDLCKIKTCFRNLSVRGQDDTSRDRPGAPGAGPEETVSFKTFVWIILKGEEAELVKSEREIAGKCLNYDHSGRDHARNYTESTVFADLILSPVKYF